MIQHYLWLVVFMWMAIEGFVMYLSLVRVFGDHISNYMLKFNLVTWGKFFDIYFYYFAHNLRYPADESNLGFVNNIDNSKHLILNT